MQGHIVLSFCTLLLIYYILLFLKKCVCVYFFSKFSVLYCYVDISPTISQNENLPAIARNARTYPTFFRIVNVFPSENETSCGTSDRPILTEKKMDE